MSDVKPLSSIDWEDDEDEALFPPMVEQARSFLEAFRWCRRISRLRVGVAVPGVVAVFLAEIEPDQAGVDERLWVVVGDVPPVYLVLDNAPDSSAALRGYVVEMRRWVDAARTGEPVEDLIPVNVEPTPEWADALAGRLDFLERHLR